MYYSDKRSTSDDSLAIDSGFCIGSVPTGSKYQYSRYLAGIWAPKYVLD